VIQPVRWADADATMISTISGPGKARPATAAGAHHVLNHREGDPAAEIRKLAPDGVDTGRGRSLPGRPAARIGRVADRR
jgi:NADPH2:quinone reductase